MQCIRRYYVEWVFSVLVRCKSANFSRGYVYEEQFVHFHSQWHEHFTYWSQNYTATIQRCNGNLPYIVQF